MKIWRALRARWLTESNDRIILEDYLMELYYGIISQDYIAVSYRGITLGNDITGLN